jgi:hypothetical protein
MGGERVPEGMRVHLALQLERRAGRDAVEQRGDVGGLDRAWERVRQAGRREEVGRIGAHVAMLHHRAEEGARGSQLARHRPGCGALVGHAGGVAAQQPVGERGRLEPLGGRPGGQLADVGAVGAPGPLGRSAALQVAVEATQGM